MVLQYKNIHKKVLADWKSITNSSEWTFHQLSPYIGKLKSSVAASLIKNLTTEGDIIYDPYCGAGTIPFEAWANNRRVIANDLNVYAYTIMYAKLNPPKNLTALLRKTKLYHEEVELHKGKMDLRKVPKWVRAFFHPKTLKEILAWCDILKRNNEYFILSALLGILHHQRPGFLSFPSSHTVPYLRIKKFPKEKFPALYEYRSVYERLERKLVRAFKRRPNLNYTISRKCLSVDASTFVLKNKADVIITSPPYMRQLDYARDNRLRLWFLGVVDFKELDKSVSPGEREFIESFKKALITWTECLKTGGKCILILGDSHSKIYKMKLPDMIIKIATEELGKYSLELKFQSIIPDKKRVRKNYQGSKRETVIVLKKID